MVSFRGGRNLVLMSFICEKLRSTEAVATGIDKHTFDRALRFGCHFLPIPSVGLSCPLPAFLKESSERFSILCVLQM